MDTITLDDLRKKLEFLGFSASVLDEVWPKDDSMTPRLQEQIVLKKFNGDDCTGEPIETIVIENGQIVSRG